MNHLVQEILWSQRNLCSITDRITLKRLHYFALGIPLISKLFRVHNDSKSAFVGEKVLIRNVAWLLWECRLCMLFRALLSILQVTRGQRYDDHWFEVPWQQILAGQLGIFVILRKLLESPEPQIKMNCHWTGAVVLPSLLDYCVDEMRTFATVCHLTQQLECNWHLITITYLWIKHKWV